MLISLQLRVNWLFPRKKMDKQRFNMSHCFEQKDVPSARFVFKHREEKRGEERGREKGRERDRVFHADDADGCTRIFSSRVTSL